MEIPSLHEPSVPEKAKPVKNRAALIVTLGALTAIAPFSIDMYLPSFPSLAADIGANIAKIPLTLSSFFIGLAAGQLFYGPLLDRYGRKPPLYGGLLLFMAATLGCLLSTTLPMLVTFRFLQAIGACAASVAPMAMVHDFFGGKESGKIFSLLILILGASPLLAPTLGSYLASAFGWRSIFWVLSAIGGAMLAVVFFTLSEGHTPDGTVSLKPGPICLNYIAILEEPRFFTYAMAGALAFSGLFVFLASSPMIFMEIFNMSARHYGQTFSLLAMGFIGASQLNILLLRWFSNEQILKAGLTSLVVMGVALCIGAWNGWLSLASTIAILFLFLASAGVSNPNASALALAPFSKNAGSAAALLGCLQMAIGAFASVCVSFFKVRDIFPMTTLFAGSAVLALATVVFGGKRIERARR
jgi:DHA1 family bicyclomycin/chloramphenicol resistance-like MFS transporter